MPYDCTRPNFRGKWRETLTYLVTQPTCWHFIILCIDITQQVASRYCQCLKAKCDIFVDRLYYISCHCECMMTENDQIVMLILHGGYIGWEEKKNENRKLYWLLWVTQKTKSRLCCTNAKQKHKKLSLHPEWVWLNILNFGGANFLKWQSTHWHKPRILYQEFNVNRLNSPLQINIR